MPDDARAAHGGRPFPIGSLLRRRSCLLLAAWLSPILAFAQAPIVQPSPDVPPDEVDFEGFTSLALGSGARAYGMGGAFLARADDATAASWNPAGLSYLRRPEFSIVGARNSFSKGPLDQEPTDEFVGKTPDFLALTYPLSSGAIQLSYQRVFSFRGDRNISRGNTRFFTEGEGGYDVIALGGGFRFGRQWRLGATINRWMNGYSQRRDRSTVTDAGRPERGSTEQDIDYDLNSGINFNLGAMWSPVESLNFGLVGKTPFTAILNLRRFRQDTPANASLPTTANTAERSDVLIDFPGAIGAGVSWRPISPLTLSADYTRTFWSEGRIRNFFRLDATPETGGEAPPPIVFTELPYPTLDDPDQTDTQQFRFGVEYVLIAGGLKIPLRGGVFSDRQLFRAQDGNPPVFWGVTVGTGLSFGPFMIDFAYLLERGEFVTADESAEVGSTRFSRTFVSIIYRHGQ